MTSTELEKRVLTIVERQGSLAPFEPVRPGESPLARDWRVIGRDGWNAVRKFEAEHPGVADRVRRDEDCTAPA